MKKQIIEKDGIRYEVVRIIEDKKLIDIPELDIQIEKSIHHKGKSYNELKEEFGEKYLEEHLPTYAQLQFLRNSDKYRKLLGLDDTWEFVKQEDKISKANGYIAVFGAFGDGADLDCYRDPSFGGSYLGVRFCFARKSKLRKNKK